MGLKSGGLRGSLRNIGTGVSAIPDSAIAHFDAQSAFGSGDDGTTVSTWTDELGNYDVTGGSPVVRESGINGFRAVEFDADDSLTAQFDATATQPNTIIGVFETSTAGTVVSGYSTREEIYWNGGDNSYAIFAGSSGVSGSNSDNVAVVTALFDGANSFIRINGAEVASGDAGGNDLDGLSLGYESNIGRYLTGYIGEMVPCDAALTTSEIEAEEQRMANKWGIALA